MRLLVLLFAAVFYMASNHTVWREPEVVVRLDTNDVWEKVAAFEGEVLDDEVEAVVRVLNAGDGDVSDLFVTLFKQVNVISMR